MRRKPRVDRSPEDKWQIVQEGMVIHMPKVQPHTIVTGFIVGNDEHPFEKSELPVAHEGHFDSRS